MHIPHTVFYTFDKVLTWRNCSTIKSFSFFTLLTIMFDLGAIWLGEIRYKSPLGVKAVKVFAQFTQ